jgi:hypothetical protein
MFGESRQIQPGYSFAHASTKNAPEAQVNSVANQTSFLRLPHTLLTSSSEA